MEVWTVVSSVWLTTWTIAVFRTYPIIIKLVGSYEGGKLIVSYKLTHAFIYIVSMFFICPFVWQLCFFEEPRRKFVLSYGKAIVKETE